MLYQESGGILAAMRRGLPRMNEKLQRNELIRVAFLGGSITEGAGASDSDVTSWRARTGQYLQSVYAAHSFQFINAGVGGTNSTLGAHRLQEHVLQGGAIDLLFVEFSVNDGEDREESVRGMEGIVRKCWRMSPGADICFLYTAAEKNLGSILPFNIAVHEKVAEYYRIPSVNFAASVYKRTQAGEMVWEELAPDGYHPNDEGHALYARYLQEYLEKALNPGAAEQLGYTVWPAVPMDKHNYEFGQLLPYGAAEYSGEFRVTELLADEPLMNWRFQTEHQAADNPGARVSFTLEGQSAGLLLLYGPDTGILEYSINGGPYTPVNLFDDWCLSAYRPVPVLFPIQKERGPLHIEVRSTAAKDERSKGTGLRVLKLLCN